MRNFDNWNRYLDNNNKPLRGCVMFNVKDGNTVAPIYDGDGTPLDNPILTDEFGRTEHQVFIDTDVVAYFYKYIGTGEFNTLNPMNGTNEINVNDDTKWSLQYTCENVNDILAHIASDSIIAIENIDALRALDVDSVSEVCGKKVITLLGYYSIGDKEAVNYVWNPSLTENDNNGSIIQGPNLTGRWVMVKPTEHCDCKHFGIFAQNTTNFNSDTARMNQWIAYCNSANIKPYFSANGDYKYYKYNNLSFTIQEVDIAKDVIFIDNGTSNVWTTEINGNPYFYNHSTNLNSKEVKTSWGAQLYINPQHIIVDNNDLFSNTAISNAIVDINVPCDKVCNFTDCTINMNASFNSVSAFTRCKINSVNMITSGCYFFNCHLTEDMFYGSPFIHVDVNCTADFDEFEHKTLMWLRIKAQQMQVNYDWRGKLTDQNPWEGVVESDRWLINYKGISNNATLMEGTAPHVYFLENCAGTITIEGKAANTYVIKDSEINLNIANDAVTGITISAQNSTINFTQEVNIANFSMRSSVVGNTNNIICDNFTSYSGIITASILARNAVVKDSQINRSFSLIAHVGEPREVQYLGGMTGQQTMTATVSHFISGYFDNNIFNDQFVIDGQYGLMGDSTTHSVIPYTIEQCLVESLVFTNNISNYAGDAWYIWANMGAWRDDSLHNYIWKGNKGKFECKTELEAIYTFSTSDVANPGIFCSAGHAHAWGKVCLSKSITDPVVGLTEEWIDLGDRYFCTMDLFSIGTLNVKFDLHFWLSGVPGNETSMNAINNWSIGNVNGYCHLDDSCVCGPFDYIPKGNYEGARSTAFQLAAVRNINCIATTQFAPILVPIGDFAWSKTFQIRNFATGSCLECPDNTHFIMHIEQV